MKTPWADVLSVSGIHPHAASRITADLGMGRVRNVRVGPPTPTNVLVTCLQLAPRGVVCNRFANAPMTEALGGHRTGYAPILGQRGPARPQPWTGTCGRRESRPPSTPSSLPASPACARPAISHCANEHPLRHALDRLEHAGRSTGSALRVSASIPALPPSATDHSKGSRHSPRPPTTSS
jgi:hypothetical protein